MLKYSGTQYYVQPRGKMCVIADLRQLKPPLLDAVFNPGHDGVKHLLLAAHVQLVTRNDVDQLIGWEQHELFTLHDLKKNRPRINPSCYNNAAPC